MERMKLSRTQIMNVMSTVLGEERITGKTTRMDDGGEDKEGHNNYVVPAEATPTGIIKMVETRIGRRGQ